MQQTTFVLVIASSLFGFCFAVCDPPCGTGASCHETTCVCPENLGGDDCTDNCVGCTACVGDDILDCKECTGCDPIGGVCRSVGPTEGERLTEEAICVCKPGFAGSNCDLCDHLDPTNACNNAGTCSALVTRTPGICTCDKDHDGKYCQFECDGTCTADQKCVATSPVDGQCRGKCDDTTHRCQNGGNCVDELCDCVGQFGGDYCDKAKCTVNQCENGGTCGPDEICICADNYAGDYCDAACDPTCSVYENCVEDTPDRDNAGKCDCIAGLSGTDCKTVDDCALCEEGSTCAEKSCSCAPNYAGTFCQYECKPACTGADECTEKEDGSKAECRGGSVIVTASWILAVIACAASKIV